MNDLSFTPDWVPSIRLSRNFCHQFFIIPTCLLFIAISVTVSAQSTFGPYELKEGMSNPLKRPLTFPIWPSPTLVDLDRDNDLDLVVGASSQTLGLGLAYYANEGSGTSPVFIEKTSSQNPFYFLVYDFSGNIAAIKPAFMDVDRDGDQDLFVGAQDGQIRFYKNITNWSAASPVIDFQQQTGEWNQTTFAGNPFHNVFAGYYTAPFAVDFDADGDQDILLGTLANTGGYNLTVHLYTNNGQGVFSHSAVNGVNPSSIQVSPIAYDYDGDGDLDIIAGDKDGNFKYFTNAGANVFSENTTLNFLTAFNLGTYTAPALADLNGDGKAELIIGSSHLSGSQGVAYLQNLGNNTYERKTGMHDPFGGIDVGSDASPQFSDIDGDGDLDVMIANRSGSILCLRNDAGKFNPIPDHANPFFGLVTGTRFSLSYVDLNGDGQKDVVGPSNTTFRYFIRSGASFTEVPLASGPFANITTETYGKADFADIDGDGDLDMILADEIPWTNGATVWGFFVRYFINTGNATSPVFEERTGTANPLNSVLEEYNLYPRFIDTDRDGDLDVVIGEGGDIHGEIPDSNEFLYYENTGTLNTPVFTYRGNLIPQSHNNVEPSPAFIDIDQDGDLDVFQGGNQGFVLFYENENTAPNVIISDAHRVINQASGSTFVDASIVINDTDADKISRAVITLGNKTAGDDFTWQLPETTNANLAVNYNSSEGKLFITGNESTGFYQALLRSVRLQFNLEETGRKSGSDGMRVHAGPVTKTFSIQVYDVDGTTPIVATTSIEINPTPNTPPVFADGTMTINANAEGTIDLTGLISDADDNVDLSTLFVTISPQHAVSTSMTPPGLMTISYLDQAFAGDDHIQIRVCDAAGACDESTITITVVNTPPVISPTTFVRGQNSIVTVDLVSITSDAENNLLADAFAIAIAPTSGANASVANGLLTIDYENITFSGMDIIGIQACDAVGDCTSGNLQVEVSGEGVTVFNAVAPRGSSELNRYLHIRNLPDENKVTIYNRWGAIVFEQLSYSNEPGQRRFEGLNDNGNSLPSGAYLYRIEYTQLSADGSSTSKVLTGYLTLQQ